jgi:hypothetical protein
MEETGRGHISDLVGAMVDSDNEDETLAAAARARYRTGGVVTIEPDQVMRAALQSDEQLLAVRRASEVERLIDGVRSPISGTLAITNKRLLVLDGSTVTLASLDELDDVTLVTDRLLVMLTNGAGLTIDAAHPRLLRVELAEARARWSETDQPRR